MAITIVGQVKMRCPGQVNVAHEAKKHNVLMLELATPMAAS